MVRVLPKRPRAAGKAGADAARRPGSRPELRVRKEREGQNRRRAPTGSSQWLHRGSSREASIPELERNAWGGLRLARRDRLCLVPCGGRWSTFRRSLK